MTDLARGGCQCQAIRFETDGAPRFVERCHCQSCRRATGGAFSTWVGFRDASVTWKAGQPMVYASSEGVARSFCQSCGTPLSYRGRKWPDETHFLLGVFDDPTAFTPTRDFCAEEALAWCAPPKEKP